MKQSRWPSIDTLILLALGTAAVDSVTEPLSALIILLVGCCALLDTAARTGRS